MTKIPRKFRRQAEKQKIEKQKKELATFFKLLKERVKSGKHLETVFEEEEE